MSNMLIQREFTDEIWYIFSNNGITRFVVFSNSRVTHRFSIRYELNAFSFFDDGKKIIMSTIDHDSYVINVDMLISNKEITFFMRCDMPVYSNVPNNTMFACVKSDFFDRTFRRNQVNGRIYVNNRLLHPKRMRSIYCLRWLGKDLAFTYKGINGRSGLCIASNVNGTWQVSDTEDTHVSILEIVDFNTRENSVLLISRITGPDYYLFTTKKQDISIYKKWKLINNKILCACFFKHRVAYIDYEGTCYYKDKNKIYELFRLKNTEFI